MLRADDGASCIYVSVEAGHLDVVKTLLEAGGRVLVMQTADDGVSSQRPTIGYQRSPSMTFFLSGARFLLTVGGW